MIHPDARDRLRFLETLENSSFNAYHDAISNPGQWYHVRVNTLKASPKSMLGILRQNHPGWLFATDASISEAIKVNVSGPNEIQGLANKIEVDKFAAESIAMSAPLFAPGFMRAMNKFASGEMVSMVTRFTTSWDGQQHEVHCGNGQAMYPSNAMYKIGKGVAVATSQSWFSSPPVQDWDEFKDGLLVDQNLPSMLAAKVLDPREGDVVVDVCCGAGGKTTHLAQLMKNTGTIKAIDRSSKKIQRLQERAARMGITCVQPVTTRSERMKHVLEPIKADKVLIDPPCSALGLRLKFYIDESARDLDNYRANQERIWDNVMNAGFVVPGTRLVYCTCTITVEENEKLIERVIEKHGLKIVDPSINPGHPGIAVETLSRKEISQMIRFYPHLDDTIGFFIAVLEKE